MGATPIGATIIMQHLLSIEDLSRDQILNLFRLTRNHQDRELGIGTIRTNKILATLFFEPSTRTRLSFESAMLRLGGRVISASDLATTSMAKGESFEDTIRIVSESYADIIVVRHPDKDAARIAAEYSAVPVVNGGDGEGEHPTQALCDMYALWRRLGGIAGIRVAIFGDVKHSRAAHSLKKGLELMDATVQEIPYHYSTQKVNLEDAQAIYITRPQLERGCDRNIDLVAYNAMAHNLIDLLPAALIMHPLPRTGEVSKDLDADPRSIYFEQAKAGVPIRTTVLAHLLDIVQL